LEVRWVGFDLDDTLHDYRGASRAAKEAVFAEVKRQATVEQVVLDIKADG